MISIVYKPFKKIKRQTEVNNNDSLTKYILDLIKDGIKHNYPSYYKIYDYVDRIFPEAEVKNIPFYVCDFDSIEQVECLGFYYNIMDIIIVSKKAPIADADPVKFIQEEILMHELFHYVFYHLGFRPENAKNKEIFSYAFMMRYWKNVLNHIDEIIIRKIYPYFYNDTDKEKILNDFLIEKKGYNLNEFKNFDNSKKQNIFRELENNFKSQIDFEIRKKEHDFIDNCLNNDRNSIIRYLKLER